MLLLAWCRGVWERNGITRKWNQGGAQLLRSKRGEGDKKKALKKKKGWTLF